MITEGERLHWHRQPDTWNKTAKRSPILLVSTPWHIFPKYLGVDGYERSLHRLSVSESEEWVCTKTVFPNSSTLRACEKTYTGFVKIYYKRVKKTDLRHKLHTKMYSVIESISGGERFSSCFYSSSPSTPLRCLCSSEFCNSGNLSHLAISIFALIFFLELSAAHNSHITLSHWPLSKWLQLLWLYLVNTYTQNLST